MTAELNALLMLQQRLERRQRDVYQELLSGTNHLGGERRKAAIIFGLNVAIGETLALMAEIGKKEPIYEA